MQEQRRWFWRVLSRESLTGCYYWEEEEEEEEEEFVLQSCTRISAEQGAQMNVDLEDMSNLGHEDVIISVISFGTTTSKLPSQVLGPPELECTWITVQVFCPSTGSLTP